ncbi:MAG TPA: hypothetical protein VI564_04625 [Candidatus Nanoarchaeia archaeon]|nr:hypothetical protein [Candidatus Nanoarchaeia archaeon]
MNKKAIFYTAAAIALSVMIIFTYSAFQSIRLNDRMDVVQTRVETMNFFIGDVEKDLEKGAFIAGFRSLLAFNQHIASNGTFIDDPNAQFKEVFLNGTLDGQPLGLMYASTFTDWANKIRTESGKVDIIFDFEVVDVQLNQTDPWDVDINLDINLDIRDRKNTSYWVRQNHLVTRVSILDFEDPLYLVNSNGLVTNTIRISNITEFVQNGVVDNLLYHMNNSYYIAHPDAPSYIMRLKGDTGNSTYGIESLVNLEEFQAQGLVLKDRSIVDYIYFGSQVTTNFRINNTPSWFKIDSGHLDTYQVTNITI